MWPTVTVSSLAMRSLKLNKTVLRVKEAVWNQPRFLSDFLKLNSSLNDACLQILSGLTFHIFHNDILCSIFLKLKLHSELSL